MPETRARYIGASTMSRGEDRVTAPSNMRDRLLA